MQSRFPFIANNCCPVFYSEHKLNMNLRVTICHLSHHLLQFKPKAPSVPNGTTATNLPVSFYRPNVPTEQERLSDDENNSISKQEFTSVDFSTCIFYVSMCLLEFKQICKQKFTLFKQLLTVCN